jgi:hypothetical protein
MNINLSNHLAIGFHKEWKSIQGLTGKNLGKLLVEDCNRQDIDIVGITAEEGKLLRDFLSVDDRFGQIKRYLESSASADIVDDHMIKVRRIDRGPLYIVRSQVIQAQPPYQSNYPTKILSFGAPYIENGMPVIDTIIEAKRLDALLIADDPAKEGLQSSRASTFSTSADFYNALVGHDAQRFPWQNSKNKKLAKKTNTPWISIGNQHSLSNCNAGIKVQNNWLDMSSTPSLVESLKTTLSQHNYRNIIPHENPITWFKWVNAFRKGIKDNAHLEFT